MPIYQYKHSCGFEQQVMLKQDKEHVVIPCYRCGRNVTARQVRDNSLTIGERDGTTGVLRKDEPTRNRRR